MFFTVNIVTFLLDFMIEVGFCDSKDCDFLVWCLWFLRALLSILNSEGIKSGPQASCFSYCASKLWLGEK